MKLVCDCGNEMEFIVNDEAFDDETIEERGSYVRKDLSKFDFWAEHDETGIVCKKCGKAIWYFA